MDCCSGDLCNYYVTVSIYMQGYHYVFFGGRGGNASLRTIVLEHFQNTRGNVILHYGCTLKNITLYYFGIFQFKYGYQKAFYRKVMGLRNYY